MRKKLIDKIYFGFLCVWAIGFTGLNIYALFYTNIVDLISMVTPITIISVTFIDTSIIWIMVCKLKRG